MDEIGVEVSLKIRSAIKAKLIELGAYVDDELPNYIMVMVANKRSKAQMDRDLGLFLEGNTANFTGWLHTVLQKLQEVTIASNVNKCNLPLAAVVEKVAPNTVKPLASSTNKVEEYKQKLKHKKQSKKSIDSRKSVSSIDNKLVPDVVKDAEKKRVTKSQIKPSESKTALANSLSKLEVKAKSPISMELETTVSKVDEIATTETVLSEDEDFEDIINIKDAGMMEFLNEELPEDIPKARNVSPPLAANQKPSVKKLVEHCMKDVDELEQQRSQLLRDLERLGNAEKLKVKLLDRSVKPSTSIHNRLGSKIDLEQRQCIIDPDEFNIVGPPPDHELNKQSVLDRLGKRTTSENKQSKTTKEDGGKRNVMDRLGKRHLSPSNSQSRSDRTNQDTKRPSLIEESHRSRKKEPIVRVKVKDRLGKKMDMGEEQNKGGTKRRITSIKDEVGGEYHKHSNTVKRTSSQETEEVPRKRLILSQVIPVKRPEEEMDQQLSVASVVRVQPRPKVPLAMQPTKNLLMRAMADAHKSIAAAPQRQEPERPLRMGGLFTKRYREEKLPVNPLPVVAKEEEEEEEEVEEEEEEEGEEEVVDYRLEMRDITRTVENPRVAIKTELKEEPEPEVMNYEEDKPESYLSESEEVLDVAEGASNNSVASGSIVGNVSPVLDESNEKIENSDPGLEENSAEELTNNDFRRSVRSDDLKRFIVTLDSLDAAKINSRKRTVALKENVLERPASPLPLQEFQRVREEERSTKRNISPVVAKKPRLAANVAEATTSDRCKYWPNCRQGEHCEYMHPTSPCKMFPKCKFGDKCLYVHPKCKYDVSCTRQGCPFMHADVRSQAKLTQVSLLVRAAQPVCKFYPKCTNVNCVFLHPKPCRFGRACNKPECSFHHDELPSGEKLRWVRAKRNHL